MTNAPDRRADARIPLEVWVEEASKNAVYFQRAANLSSGGLYLENSVPHPVGTRMEIRFTLPGDDQPLKVTAEIVRIEQVSALGMHLKFVDLPKDAEARIHGFIDRAHER